MSWTDADVVASSTPQGAWTDADIVTDAPKRGFDWKNVPGAAIEPNLTLLSGMAAAPVSGLAGIAGTLLPGKKGQGADWVNKVGNALTWQPMTEGGATPHPITYPFRKLAEGADQIGGNVAEATGSPLVGAAINTAIQTTPMLFGSPKVRGKIESAASPIIDAVAARRTRMDELAARKSQLNAPFIDAAKKAQTLGIALDPAKVNPTVSNRVKRVIVGGDNTNVALSNANEAKWSALARDDLSIDPHTALSETSLKAGRAEAGKPYAEVARIPAMVADETLMNELGSASSYAGNSPQIVTLLKKDMPTLVEDVSAAVKSGFNGKDILDLTRKYRKEANQVYKQTNATPENIALADAKKSVSNSLEDAVGRNLERMNQEQPGRGYNDLLNRFKSAREYIAKSHTYENAIDFNTGILDPKKIAKQTSKSNPLTGTQADIGAIAGNFPEVSKINATLAENTHPHLTRSSLGGSAGLAIGAAAGNPILGALSGAALARVVEALGAKRVTSPKVQSKIEIPDARPMREQLGYGKGPMAPDLVQMTNPTRGEFQLNADAIRRAEIDAVLQAAAASRANPPINPLAAQEAARQAANVEAAQQAGVSRGTGAPNRSAIEQAVKRAEIDAVLQAAAASRARNQRSNKP